MIIPSTEANRRAAASVASYYTWRNSKLCPSHVHRIILRHDQLCDITGHDEQRYAATATNSLSVIFKMESFKRFPAVARFSCFEIPVETFTSPIIRTFQELHTPRRMSQLLCWQSSDPSKVYQICRAGPVRFLQRSQHYQ